MKNYLQLMRIKHYIKNFLIFIPLFFSENLLNISLLLKVFISFISFNLMCSSIYIVNDINDMEKDRKHPIKKNRPLASGKISKQSAEIFLFVLLIMSIILNFIANGKLYMSYIYLLLYFILNLLYSKGLKNVALLDIIILVSGFIIRILYGGVIVNVQISNWLYLTIMSMSFYLGLGKRRNELDKNGQQSRKVLSKYSREFLDKNMYLCLGLTIVFYSLWCIDPMISKLHPALIYTIPLILVICMKYSLIVEGSSFGDPVDVLTKSKILILLVISYIISIAIIFYL
jgi:decaprenyl-phosphate phosphoribosyltransferase